MQDKRTDQIYIAHYQQSHIVEGRPLDSVMDQMLEEERVFFRYLDSQLAMVDTFYKGSFSLLPLQITRYPLLTRETILTFMFILFSRREGA